MLSSLQSPSLCNDNKTTKQTKKKQDLPELYRRAAEAVVAMEQGGGN